MSRVRRSRNELPDQLEGAASERGDTLIEVLLALANALSTPLFRQPSLATGVRTTRQEDRRTRPYAMATRVLAEPDQSLTPILKRGSTDHVKLADLRAVPSKQTYTEAGNVPVVGRAREDIVLLDVDANAYDSLVSLA